MRLLSNRQRVGILATVTTALFLWAGTAIPGTCKAATIVDVGTRKQLLFDNLFLEKSRGVQVRMNLPHQDPEPVLVPDRPWELAIAGSATVLFDEGKFRMWYDASGPGKPTLFLAYAESTDGVHWHKPSLGLVEYDGSKQNNILAPSHPDARTGGGTVFRDDHGPAAERYKWWSKYYASDEQRARGIRSGLYAWVSPDGLHWQRLGSDRGYPLSRGNAADTQNVCFWDADVGKYIGFVRKKMQEDQTPTRRDSEMWIGLMTSDDFENWTWAQDIFRADEEFPVPGGKPQWQPPVNLYEPVGMKVPGVPNAYILLPTPWYHWERNGLPSTIDVELATSRDRVHWWQPAPEDRQPFLRLGPDGSASSGMLFASPWPVVVGDEVWIYYCGIGALHPYPGGGGRPSHGTGIFRSRIRRDGFVSVDAGYRGGEFTTPVLTFEGGKSLQVSLDGSAGGWLQVELLTAGGVPIPNYELDACDTIRGNSLTKTITWRGRRSDMSRLAHTPIRLRFVMRSMKLFAFQFVESDYDE